MTREAVTPRHEWAGSDRWQKKVEQLAAELEAGWTASGGRASRPVDKKKIDEIDQQYPRLSGAADEQNLLGRVIATVMLAFETAGKVVPLEEIDARLEKAGVFDQTEETGNRDLLGRIAGNEALAKIILERQLVVRRVEQAYGELPVVTGYDAIQSLRDQTSQFSSDNVAALAIISKMQRMGQIGNVTKGKAESLIRLMLESEGRQDADGI